MEMSGTCGTHRRDIYVYAILAEKIQTEETSF
jgi:hypothetical protein